MELPCHSGQMRQLINSVSLPPYRRGRESVLKGLGQEANIAGMPVSHGGPRQHAPNSEQGNGGPENPARPLPPRFWGAMEKIVLRGWHSQGCDDMNAVA